MGRCRLGVVSHTLLYQLLALGRRMPFYVLALNVKRTPRITSSMKTGEMPAVAVVMKDKEP